MPIQRLAGALLALGLLFPPAAQPTAVTIDGTLDPGYGVALSTQTNATVGWPDASLGLVGGSNGYELDQAYGFVSDGTLHLFLAGNLLCQGDPVDYGIYTYNLYLFIDSGAGGQNRLRADNADLDYGSLDRMAGLTFDTGFEPDDWLACRGYTQDFYDPTSDYTLYAWQAELLTGGGGGGYLLGTSGAGGPGILSGGTNPDGIQVTIDNRNTAGVTSGCGASSGAGVTTGVEWAIPLAAIGGPTGCVRVCAVVATSAAYSFLPQVLGPLPPGSCALGAPSGVDFNNYAGEQFFTVCGENTPARTSSWGRLKTLYR
jgi:hypothetical protein